MRATKGEAFVLAFPEDWPGYAVKRALDFTVALVLLIMLLPLMAFIAVALKLADAGRHARFTVGPGLTSPWIANGNGDVKDFDAIAASHIEYIRTWTLWRDLRILYETAAYVITGSNH